MRKSEQSARLWILVCAMSAMLAFVAAPGRSGDENDDAGKKSVEQTDRQKAKQAATKTKTEKAIEELLRGREEEQKAQQEKLRSDPAWQPSHQQTAVIHAGPESKPVAPNSFCLNIDGNLLVACGGQKTIYAPSKDGEVKPKTVGEPAEIRVLDPEGKLLHTWELDFTPQTINVDDQGTIYVGGYGHVAKLDQNGKVLLKADSPQMSELPPLPPIPEKKEPAKEDDAAKEARKKKIDELTAKVNEAQKTYGKARQEARLAAEPPANPTPEQNAAFQAKMEELMEKLIAAQRELQEASMSPELWAMQQRMAILQKASISAIAVSGKDVFVACPMTKGFGYAVWRTDADFGNAKKIIERLMGCCGQMDVQAKDGEVWVAHNARHKVEHYDRDGKKLSDFGKTDRKNADGFGGCCEPKNLRFAQNGELLACESGPPVAVKRFTTDGKFLGVVAMPTFNSGCVRVTVDISRDGSQVFVLNSGENAIHVLTEKRTVATHKQTAVFPLLDVKKKPVLRTFCLDGKGNLLVACGGRQNNLRAR